MRVLLIASPFLFLSHLTLDLLVLILRHNFLNQILQREVEIEVESMDKGGNFIGYLFTKEGNDNLSELLVK